MRLSFHKMHSLGNDFVVLDAVTQNLRLNADQIRWLADRHRGVGFDQLLLIEPPTDPDCDFQYTIYNADGSQAQQCGNGTRAVALLVNLLGLSAKSTIVWQSLAGTFTTRFVSPTQIETTMTVPVLEHAAIPFDPSRTLGSNEAGNKFELGIDPSSMRPSTTDSELAPNHSFWITPVSMGNPHAVTIVDDVGAMPVPEIGAQLTEHPAFPERTNVGFCQIVDEQFIRLRVYERGTGETQACGTGACAAVVATRLLGLTGTKVKVSLPGGKLRMHWPEVNQPILMSGDAHRVFEGTVTLPTTNRSNKSNQSASASASQESVNESASPGTEAAESDSILAIEDQG